MREHTDFRDRHNPLNESPYEKVGKSTHLPAKTKNAYGPQ